VPPPDRGRLGALVAGVPGRNELTGGRVSLIGDLQAVDDELTRNVHRWLEADVEGQDDEADSACRAVFGEALSEPAVPLTFAARTMEAIGTATAQDARRAHLMRRAMLGGGALGGVAAAYFGGAWAIATLSAIIIRSLDLLLGATVRVASSVQAGADAWTVLSSIGRAVGAFVSDPTVTVAMLTMQGLAIAALFALQRLLGTDTEPFK
jgi:hypothetical protein